MGRKDFNGQSLVENEKLSIKKIINRYHPEASICEQFVSIYSSSDINELGAGVLIRGCDYA